MYRRRYSYLYIVIMVFYIVRPLMPYIEYAVNKEYIAATLCVSKDVPGNCCQGKCYLHKQLDKSAENNDSDQNNNENKTRNNKLDDHLIFSSLSVTPVQKAVKLLIDNSVMMFNPFSDPIFIPPRTGL